MTTLAPAGARVAVDGRPLDAGSGAELVAGTRETGPPEVVSTASFTLVLDPGTHVIVVSAPGGADLVVTRDLAPGASAPLTLSLALPALAPPPVAARSSRRLGPAIAFGVGGAGALMGAVFGALAIRNKGELDATCPQKNRCPGSEQGTLDAMNAFAAVSTAGVVAAVAGAGVGTILLLTDDRSAPRAPVTLSFGPAYAGVRGWF